MFEIDKKIQFFFLGFTVCLIAAILNAIYPDEKQEPALSRYCINYCVKEQLALIHGDVEYSMVIDHCEKFFENISCCKQDDEYGECNIDTLRRLQKK